VITWNLTLK